MKATPKEEARALRLLKKCRIEPEEIERFSFMQRYTMPQSGDKPEKVVYGPGIMVLHLKDGNDRLLPPSFSHPLPAVARYSFRQLPGRTDTRWRHPPDSLQAPVALQVLLFPAVLLLHHTGQLPLHFHLVGHCHGYYLFRPQPVLPQHAADALLLYLHRKGQTDRAQCRTDTALSLQQATESKL